MGIVFTLWRWRWPIALLITIIGSGGYVWWNSTKWYDAGYSAAENKMKAETATESARRSKVIEDNFALANDTAQKLIAEESKNAELLRRLDALAAQDDRPCLSRDTVDQLRAIGKDRSPASRGADIPPG